MPEVDTILIGAGIAVPLYLAFVLGLIVAGKRTHARALAGFIPDCLVLLKRLLADRRVSRSRKLVLVVLVGYLAMPFDLVPDFIPVVGVLDDVVVAAVALRVALRAGGADLLREHWPGPASGLAAVIRVAYGRRRNM